MESKLFGRDAESMLQEYLPVNVNLRYETLSSHLALVEQRYILPLIGRIFYDHLVAASSSSSPKEVELRKMIRFAMLRLALWKGFDVINSNISDTGMSSGTEKDSRLFRYQEEGLRVSLKNEGFDYLDSILAFLEENAPDFPEFSGSDYKLSNVHSLIRNTAEFQECYDIDNSRLVFLKMKKYVRDVELIKLQHRIGAAFYQELVRCDRNVEKYASILRPIMLFVVYSAVAEGIDELHKLPTEKGLVFEVSSMDGVEVSPVEYARVMETRAALASKAEQYMSSAIHYIREHKEDYPRYVDFAGDSPDNDIVKFNNKNRKIFVV